jgi:hypothetical protein
MFSQVTTGPMKSSKTDILSVLIFLSLGIPTEVVVAGRRSEAAACTTTSLVLEVAHNRMVFILVTYRGVTSTKLS